MLFTNILVSRRRYILTLAAATLSAVLLSILLATNSSAATITVNTTNMTSTAQGTAQPGECSIIDAFAAAETDTAVNACPAGNPGLDLVTLPAGTFDLDQIDPSDTVAWAAASLRGAGVDQTIITGRSLNFDLTTSNNNYDISGFTLHNTAISFATFGATTTNTAHFHNLKFDLAALVIFQQSDNKLETTIENSDFIADSSLNIPDPDDIFSQIGLSTESTNPVTPLSATSL